MMVLAFERAGQGLPPIGDDVADIARNLFLDDGLLDLNGAYPLVPKVARKQQDVSARRRHD